MRDSAPDNDTMAAMEPAEMVRRLDACLATARSWESMRYGYPRVSERGRLLVGYLCDPTDYDWSRIGGRAVRDAVQFCVSMGADEEALLARYGHVFAMDAAEAVREMDLLDCGGAHLEGWTAPDHGNEPETSRPAWREKAGKTARGQEMNAETSGAGKASAGRSKRTAKERREAAGEVDMLAGVCG